MGSLLLFSGGLFLICLVSIVLENWIEWHISHWFEFMQKTVLFVDPSVCHFIILLLKYEQRKPHGLCVTGLLFAEINLKFCSDVIKYLFTFMFEGERCGLAVCVMSKPRSNTRIGSCVYLMQCMDKKCC